MSLRQLQTAFLHLQFSFLPKSSHFFPKVLISSKKFSFLPKSSHCLQKVLISCNADRISSPQFSFLPKSSHFFPKVLISSKKFSFLHKSSHFLKCEHDFFTPAAPYLVRTVPRRDIAGRLRSCSAAPILWGPAPILSGPAVLPRLVRPPSSGEISWRVYPPEDETWRAS
jgi:hypothetical protein